MRTRTPEGHALGAETETTALGDEQLRRDVLAELQWDPRVHGTQVEVRAAHGVVTLRGTVTSYGEKVAAGRAAARVPGVRDVVNETDVRLPAPQQGIDAALAERIEQLLAWNAALRGTMIQARVVNGLVTLAGQVDWPYQKQLAGQRVEELDGVAGIANDIDVRQREGKVTAERVKEQILAALHRHATIEATRIRVSVIDGKVALEGVVDAVYERKLIEDAVWCTAGVKEVVDQLSIR